MNSKKIKLIAIILIAVITFGTIGFCIHLKYQNSNNIPNDYIAIFNGGTGEITYSTYIYKIDNGHDNYGFKYINATNTTVSWGNPNWKIKITDKGEVARTDDIFAVAKENNAYSYVSLPNDNKTYSIEEFMTMFLKD